VEPRARLARNSTVHIYPIKGAAHRVAAGDSFDRLVQVKRKYDPDNLFRLNQKHQAVSTGLRLSDEPSNRG
jgi:Berberine and berberine like